MALILPVDYQLVTRLLAEGLSERASVSGMVKAILSDLGLTLETLQRANSILIAEHREPVVDVQHAVVRMGSENLVDLLRNMPSPKSFLSGEHELEYSHLRTRSYMMSLISKEISNIAGPEMTNESQVAGLLINLPLHLCCIAKPEDFMRYRKSVSLKALPNQIRKATKFHPVKESIRYLRRQSIPSRVHACLDWNIPCTAPRELKLRFIANAAKEVIEAYNTDKWLDYMQRGSLPSRSAFRLLSLTDQKYEKLMFEVKKMVEGSSLGNESA